MKNSFIPIVALCSCLAASCSNHDAHQYDTPATTAALPPAQSPTTQTSTSANPVYDSPAAYEENTNAQARPALPPIEEPSASPQRTHTSAAPVPAAPSNGAAIIHTVVPGDTLGGIARKYKVSSASIKQANRMTNDTVILGRKMVIPPQ